MARPGKTPTSGNNMWLLDNPNPPTVDQNYKSHTPDTVNHNDIYNTCPSVTLPPPPQRERAQNKEWSDNS